MGGQLLSSHSHLPLPKPFSCKSSKQTLRTSLLQWEGISSAREKEKRSEKKLNLYICGLLFNQSSRHMSINGFYRFAIKRHAPENIEQPHKTYTNRPKHCKSITSRQHRAPVTIDLCVRLVLHLQGVEGRTEEGESEHSNCTTCWRQSNTALTECDGVCVCVCVREERGRINRLICDTRSHTTHTHTSYKHKHTTTQHQRFIWIPCSSGSSSGGGGGGSGGKELRQRDTETQRHRETERREVKETIFTVWQEKDSRERGRQEERERQAFIISNACLWSQCDGRPHVPAAVCLLSVCVCVCAVVGGCVQCVCVCVCVEGVGFGVWWGTQRAWRASWRWSGPEPPLFDFRCLTRLSWRRGFLSHW